jgi:acyl carrier protein
MSETFAARGPGQSSVDDVVQRMVGRFAPEPPERAQPGDRILEDHGFDSLRLLEMAFALEDLFQLDPASLGEAPPIGTVSELGDYLAEKVATGQATVPDMADVEAAIEAATLDL